MHYDKDEPWMYPRVQAVLALNIKGEEKPMYVGVCLPQGYAQVLKKGRGFVMDVDEKNRTRLYESLSTLLMNKCKGYASLFQKHLNKKIIAMKAEEAKASEAQDSEAVNGQAENERTTITQAPAEAANSTQTLPSDAGGVS